MVSIRKNPAMERFEFLKTTELFASVPDALLREIVNQLVEVRAPAGGCADPDVLRSGGRTSGDLGDVHRRGAGIKSAAIDYQVEGKLGSMRISEELN